MREITAKQSQTHADPYAPLSDPHVVSPSDQCPRCPLWRQGNVFLFLSIWSRKALSSIQSDGDDCVDFVTNFLHNREPSICQLFHGRRFRLVCNRTAQGGGQLENNGAKGMKGHVKTRVTFNSVCIQMREILSVHSHSRRVRTNFAPAVHNDGNLSLALSDERNSKLFCFLTHKTPDKPQFHWRTGAKHMFFQVK